MLCKVQYSTKSPHLQGLFCTSIHAFRANAVSASAGVRRASPETCFSARRCNAAAHDVWKGLYLAGKACQTFQLCKS